ncbi:MAG: VOC family protein [Myxococcota bacterium]
MESQHRFFFYIYCKDLVEMRAFYSQLLCLEEVFFAEGAEGGLGYHIGHAQLTIFEASQERVPDSSWHRQPGWRGGVKTSPSWSIQFTTSREFRSAVQRLVRADVPRFYQQPRWQGYWSFPVKDPMGNTVELTCSPADAPAKTVWED